MSVSSVQYHVHMDQKTFRSFAAFDIFRLKKRARLPIFFFCIMTAFAAVALCSGKPQSGLIAGVLWAIGIGMPAVYVCTFLWQVKKQGQTLKLDTRPAVYTVTLAHDGICVHNDLRSEADLRLEWERLYRVIRRKSCFYLYAVPSKAFILPDRDANCSAAEALQLIRAHLPSFSS